MARDGYFPQWRSYSVQKATLGLVVLLTTSVAGRFAFAEPPASAPAATQTLTLHECLELASSKQPNLAARRASLSAAIDSQRALECMHIPTCLARDLPCRRQQA